MRVLPILFAGVSAAAQNADFFESRVRPALAANCYSCHSARAKTPFAGLRVDSREALLKGGDRGPAIVPGKPSESRLIQAVRHRTIQMPPNGKLPEEQIAALEKWIADGAPWPEEKPVAAPAGADPVKRHPDHWAWQPVKTHSGASIDALVRARLAAEGLRPSAEADGRTLVRRAYYDLIGLPPSAEQAEAFARNFSPDAWSELVDRLLESKHFGERWGRYWLDLARYSDVGFASVRFPYAWSYRDWVVDALNEDLPYDRFILHQLAADQASDGERHRAALGFLALGLNPPRNTSIPERVDDRIDAVSRTFLGLTVSCARCHDHKYDPIATKDYYALYGVFANTVEAPDPLPLAARSSSLDRFYVPRLADRRAIIDRYKQSRLEEMRAEASAPEQAMKYLAAAVEGRTMTNAQLDNLSRERNVNLFLLRRWRAFLDTPRARAFVAGSASAESLARELASSGFLASEESPTRIPMSAFIEVQTEGDYNTVNNLTWQRDRIFADYGYRSAAPRAMAVTDRAELLPAHVFIRGNANDPGDAVERRFLGLLNGVAPKPFENGAGRLDLARAIADPRNPLTARVAVNRVWMNLFGEGLVRTPSDFGVRGDTPTHPELLDHLAAGFMADGWSVKRLIRRIMMSETYRQSSADNSDARRKDPDNRLLWRMNRRRLDFEALRDSMLAASGRLDARIGGPPFALDSVPAEPRRAMYAYIERERANALLKSFNFADPEQHTPQRFQTTVPQQALFMLNSSFVAEQARALAARARDPRELFRLALGRDPLPQEAKLAPVPEAAAPVPDPKGSWLYGTARLDPHAGRLRDFRPFRFFANDQWQGSSLLPAADSGNAFLSAVGGAPGDGVDHAVVRRWVSPVSGTVTIVAPLTHTLNQFDQRFKLTNGIRAWVISSRQGKLFSWKFGPPADKKEFTSAESRVHPISLSGIQVEPGETLDFAVDSLDDPESDNFLWTPVITHGASKQQWHAQKDFRGPAVEPLTPWQQFAQVLLLTNEFAFID